MRLGDHSTRYADSRAAVLDEFVSRTDHIYQTRTNHDGRDEGEVDEVPVFDKLQDVVRDPSRRVQQVYGATYEIGHTLS